MICGIAVDSLGARELVRSILNIPGLDVWEAEDDKAAVLLALTRPPDLLIVDVGLSGIDGMAVVAQLRSMRALFDTKVLALTGSQSEAQQQSLRENGFDRVLIKPIRAASLRSAISELISIPSEHGIS